MLGLMKNRKISWDKEYELSIANWGKLNRDHSFTFLFLPHAFRDKDAAFSQVKGSNAHMRGRSQSPSCRCHFPNAFSLKYSIGYVTIFSPS